MLALFFLTSAIFALPPPAYLDIPAWKNCTSSIVKGDAKFICLPPSQPMHCPSASWKLLQNQKLIESCLNQ
jgi:hypothetical protein